MEKGFSLVVYTTSPSSNPWPTPLEAVQPIFCPLDLQLDCPCMLAVGIALCEQWFCRMRGAFPAAQAEPHAHAGCLRQCGTLCALCTDIVGHLLLAGCLHASPALCMVEAYHTM